MRDATLNSGDTIGKVEKAARWPTEQLSQRCNMVLVMPGFYTPLGVTFGGTLPSRRCSDQRRCR